MDNFEKAKVYLDKFIQGVHYINKLKRNNEYNDNIGEQFREKVEKPFNKICAKLTQDERDVILEATQIAFKFSTDDTSAKITNLNN